MRLSLFVGGTLLACSLAARADTVYTYTGQNFTQGTGPYATSDRVIGSFTVAAPLEANLSNYSFTPEYFRFNDGVQTLISENALNVSFDSFMTNANGDITGYSVSVASYLNRTAFYLTNVGSYMGDQVFDPRDEEASNESAGSFSQQSAPIGVTPEPSSIALLGTGLLGIAGVMKRRLA